MSKEKKEKVIEHKEEIKETPIKEQKKTQKHSQLVRYAVLGGIVILTNLFIIYALNIAYPEPQYNNFCKVEQVKKTITSEEQCVADGGQWNVGMDDMQGKVNSYCNQDFTCSQDYEKVLKLYQRNVFIVFVVFGMALLGGSIFLSGSTLVASGLSFSGILAFIIGSIWYWSNMNDILRVVIIGSALVTLLVLAWKKFED